MSDAFQAVFGDVRGSERKDEIDRMQEIASLTDFLNSVQAFQRGLTFILGPEAEQRILFQALADSELRTTATSMKQTAFSGVWAIHAYLAGLIAGQKTDVVLLDEVQMLLPANAQHDSWIIALESLAQRCYDSGMPVIAFANMSEQPQAQYGLGKVPRKIFLSPTVQRDELHFFDLTAGKASSTYSFIA